MKEKRLSFRQGMALLWCAQLSAVTERLPGTGGGAGILAVLLLGAAVSALGLTTGRLYREDGGLAGALERRLGRWCLYVYLVWGVLLLALRLRLASARLLDTGERDGGGWFFLLVLAALALWIGCGKLDALGRMGELVLGILAVTGGVVLLLALPQVKGENLLSCVNIPEDGLQAGLGAAAGVLGCGLFTAFLLEPEERDRGRWLRWTAAGSLLLAAAQGIVLGCFGPKLAASLDNPFHHLAKGVGVKGAFQRVEGIAAALWTFGDLVLLAGILWAIRRLITRSVPGADGRRGALAATLLALAGAGMLGRGEKLAELVEKTVVPVGSLVLGMGVPLTSLAIRSRR